MKIFKRKTENKFEPYELVLVPEDENDENRLKKMFTEVYDVTTFEEFQDISSKVLDELGVEYEPYHELGQE